MLQKRFARRPEIGP